MVHYCCETGSLADEGWKKDVMAQRFLTFHFKGNKLIGYAVSSSYKDDVTEFTADNISKIEKGVTTRNQVVELMGSRFGEWMYPLTDQPDKRLLIYSYNQYCGILLRGWKHHQKELKITYDANNAIVTDVDFAMVGEQ